MIIIMRHSPCEFYTKCRSFLTIFCDFFTQSGGGDCPEGELPGGTMSGGEYVQGGMPVHRSRNGIILVILQCHTASTVCVHSVQ